MPRGVHFLKQVVRLAKSPLLPPLIEGDLPKGETCRLVRHGVSSPNQDPPTKSTEVRVHQSWGGPPARCAGSSHHAVLTGIIAKSPDGSSLCKNPKCGQATPSRAQRSTSRKCTAEAALHSASGYSRNQRCLGGRIRGRDGTDPALLSRPGPLPGGPVCTRRGIRATRSIAQTVRLVRHANHDLRRAAAALEILDRGRKGDRPPASAVLGRAVRTVRVDAYVHHWQLEIRKAAGYLPASLVDAQHFR